MKTVLHYFNKALLIIIVLVISSFSAYSQRWRQVKKVVASDRGTMINDEENSRRYGASVAVSGNYALAATEEANGVIYILKNEDGKWKQIKRMPPPEDDGWGAVGGYSRDGRFVAIDGDYAVVGAIDVDEDSIETNDLANSGAAYILKKDMGGADNWGILKKITPSRPFVGDRFGFSVAISGDYIVVSAPFEDEDQNAANNIENSGSAFIFKKDQGGTDNWGEVKKITSDVREIDGFFGSSVSIKGDYILVGASTVSGEGGRSSDPGAAYVFKKDQGGADQWGLVKRIVSSDGSDDDYFGFSVAINGDYCVVGAHLEDQGSGSTLAKDAGSAYIFKKDLDGVENWGQLKKITASDRQSLRQFGSAVAIDGEYIAVGSRNWKSSLDLDAGRGAGYIFKKNFGGEDNWGEIKRINAVGNSTGAEFGSTVAMSSGLVVVGAKGVGEVAGAAFFYQKDTYGEDNWGQAQKMVKMTTLINNYYGNSVAISGNYAVVGAPYDGTDADGQNYIVTAGSAYILFNNNGNWEQVKKINASQRMQYANFGSNLAISGDYILVGAPSENNATGAVYLFGKDEGGINNWGLIKKLMAKVPEAGDRFGYSVSISGDNILIGAPYEQHNVFETNPLVGAGSAFLFTKNQDGENNWGLVRKLTAPNRVAGLRFGNSVSISGNDFMIGVPGESFDENDQQRADGAGAAYIYQKDIGGVDQWGISQKIVRPVRRYYDGFGSLVSIGGNHAMAAISQERGNAEIYERSSEGPDNWEPVKKVVPSHEGYGTTVRSIEIKGDYAVISTAGNDGNWTFVYNKDASAEEGWRERELKVANNNALGSGISIDGQYIIIGSPYDDLDESGNNTVTNAGSVYIFESDSPLPVTLATFEAAKNENTALLKWTTSSETNTDRFEILRSTDAKSWETLGYVQAAKESTELLSYTFTDNKPASGENFYRLKMIDRDGTFAYSRIRNLSFDIAGNVTLYPNPVSDNLFFTEAEIDKIASVSVINVLGQTVIQVSKITKEGIAIHQLAAGMYLVQVRKKNGNMQMNKVVVAR